ncbi:hypothetical protein [Allorhodopirellula heiligendammensis]|uniref:Uncharacterized protein n=1 Tax=Allorhodopirellula heiligendammensis TaxID=2714739 RepID=A0A5C6AZE5_9BACT|nr:hypothetical protein [Allorhodopirellula heiligendammensis]TWU05415.1 hypothetical protein Poly21_56790 [Allorhodopirellula heiligendammensis]
MTKRARQWIATLGAIVALIVLGPTIFDRFLLFRFNHAIADVRDANISSVRFKPHVDREFVTISEPKVLSRIQGWLGTSRTPKAFYSYPPTTCPLEITLTNGNVERFDISPTGLTTTYIAELDADRSFARERQFSYIMLSYDGYYRLLSDQPFTPYLRATDQLDPAAPKPFFMYSHEDDIGTE